MTQQFKIQSPGILSLLQDAGRYGQHTIGLTSGGPMDPLAYKWANRLLNNDENATVIETTVGGLKLKSNTNTYIAITGAKAVVKINGAIQPQWQTLSIKKEFSRHQQRMFFYHDYTISELCDRMGYRLSGPQISCKIDGILSEGIALGAIQVPKDGQPIILMNDRQTIGGYPKIGSVLSLDLAKLAQLTQGAKVRFEPITIDHAHNLLSLAQHKFQNTQLEPVAFLDVKL